MKFLTVGLKHSLTLFLFPILLSESAVATRWENQNLQVETTFQDPNRSSAQQLLHEGVQLTRQGTIPARLQAIAKWEAAVSLWRTAGDKSREALTLLKLASAYKDLGATTLALSRYNQALTLYRSLGNRLQVAYNIGEIGRIYVAELEQWDGAALWKLERGLSVVSARSRSLLKKNDSYRTKAREFYSQSLAIYREINKSQDSPLAALGEARILNIMAGSKYLHNDEEDREKLLKQSLAIYREIGDRSGEALVLGHLSELYLSPGYGKTAAGWDLFNQAMAIYREIAEGENFSVRQAEANLLNMAVRYSCLNNQERALQYHDRALKIYRKIGVNEVPPQEARPGEALALTTLGDCYSASQNRPQELAVYDRALGIYQAIGDRVGAANVLYRLGSIYADLGSHSQALEFRHRELETLKQITQFYTQLGDAEQARFFAYRQPNVLFDIGKIYQQLSDREKELEAYTQAKTVYQKWGDREGEVNFSLAIAEQYGNREDPESAIAFLNQAIAVYREIGDRPAEANLLLRKIAQIYFYKLKNPSAGFDALDLALNIYREIGDRAAEALTLTKLGYFSINVLEDRESALKFYQQAVPIYQELEDAKEQVYTLQTIGEIYYKLGDRTRALAAFDRAGMVYRKTGDRALAARTLTAIGGEYRKWGDKETALKFYRQARRVYRKLDDYQKEAGTLLTIAQLYYELENLNQAVATFKQARRVYQKNGDRAGEAWIAYRIGQTYRILGDLEKALQSYRQALTLYEAELDAPLRSERTLDIFIRMARLYSYLGEQDKAGKLCHQSLTHAREFPKSKIVRRSEMFREIGKLCYQIGDRENALASFEGYWHIYQQLGPDREAVGLIRIGKDYSELGDPDMALSFFDRARQVYSCNAGVPACVPEGELTTLRTIGSIYFHLGNQQQSLDFFNASLRVAREMGDRNSTAMLLADIGAVYSELGDAEKALPFYKQSLEIYRTLGDRRQETAILNNIAVLYQRSGELEKALALYQQSLAIARENGFIDLVSTSRDLGQLYYQLGDLPQALSFFNQALDVLERPSISIYIDIGKVYSDSGDFSRALEFFNKALMLADRRPEQQAETRFNIAKVERQLGNLDRAITQIEAAITQIEAERARKNSPEARQAFFADKQDYYEFYLDLLMELHGQDPAKGYDARALNIKERSQARSLLELLAEANIDIRKGVDPELVIQERSLQQQLDALEARRVKLYSGDYSIEEKTAIEQERTYLLQKYRQVQSQIRETSPSYGALTQPQPLTAREIQQQILDRDTLLLQYSLGKERSFLWAVTQDSITSYQLPPRASIERAVKKFRHLVSNRRTVSGRLSLASDKLYQMILAPVAEQLGDRRLLIVGDGILHYLPFGALSLPSASQTYLPLVDKHEIVNLPSASTLAILRRDTQARKQAPKTLAILADPVFSSEDNRLENPTATRSATWQEYILSRAAQQLDIGVWARLPGTRREAEAILALVHPSESTHVFDFAANRDAATTQELNQYQIIHFATHGLLNSVNPELSGIILSMVDERGNSQNGFLRLHDVFNLDLAADLVVLSACKTGLGKQVRGEGLVGLTRGFMYAGAPRVLVSLWDVDDAATAEMMSRFYRLMLQDKLSATAALRAAQRQMQTETQWTSPYYWAAFTLQGEWR